MRLNSLFLFLLVLLLLGATAIDGQAGCRRGGLFKRLRGSQSCTQQAGGCGTSGCAPAMYSPSPTFQGGSCPGGVCPVPSRR